MTKWKLFFFFLLIASTPLAAQAVTLKCTTTVTNNGSVQAQGDFYLELTPNPTVSNFTNFKVLTVSNGHTSFVKDTNCSVVSCLADTTDTKYSLVKTARADFYLNIVIDRTNGSYYAEEGASRFNFLGVPTWTKLVEAGNCSPGTVPNALF